MDRGKINPNRSASLSWSNTVAGARCRGVGQQYPQPFELTAGYSDFRNEETGANGTRRSAALRQYFLRADFQAQWGGLDIDYGGNLKLLQYSATLSDRFALPESFSELVDIFRLYGAAEWTPNDHLTMKPSIGVQYLVTEAKIPTLEPRLRVSYRPGGGSDKEVSVALGRYKQLDAGITDERDPGTVFTVFRPAEDGDPLPGALHGLLAYRQHVGNHFETTLEGYVKRHRHIPVSEWSPKAQLEVETARARGTAFGADLRVSYDQRPLYLSVGYGWSEVTYTAESDDLGAWIEDPVFEYNPAHDRRHKVNAVASYRVGDYTASLQWSFGSGRPYTQVYGFDLSLDIPRQNPLRFPGTGSIYFSQPYGERFPPYHRLDVSLERDFNLGAGVSIDAEIGAMNVYNRQNIFYYDLRTLRRVDQTPFFPYLSLRMNVN